MHNYLRAIGFSNLQNEKNIKEILTEVFHDFDEREVSREGKNKAFVEYTKSFGENMGIKMCGIMDTDGLASRSAGRWIKTASIRSIISHIFREKISAAKKI